MKLRTTLLRVWRWPDEMGRKYLIVRLPARAVFLAMGIYLVYGLSFGATARGAGIQAEQVLTEPMTGNRGTREHVEVGRWSQDERGRTR